MNVLWLMTDEQRCDSLGFYGSPWARTPNLDRLAADGVVFENAVTPSPVCAPARASILTGMHCPRTGLWYNRTQGELPFLTQVFRDAGYRTATFGKQHYGAPNRPFDEQNGPMFGHVKCCEYDEPYDAADYDMLQYPPEPYPWIFGGRYPADPETTSEATNVRDALAWLDANGDEPFFLRLSFNGPHTPVATPPPFDTLIDPEGIDLPAMGNHFGEGCPEWIAETLASAARSDRLTPEQALTMRRYYYGLVAYLDAQFGRLLDGLRERGLAEDTVVALVSDHGTHLCDHGLVQKQTFYDCVVNVPFMLSGAGVASGARVETPVETLSLMPTLLDLCGLDVPDALDGPSLAQCVGEGREPEARPVFSGLTLGSFELRPDDRLVMVRDGRWKFTCCLDPEPCDFGLYDLVDDPAETCNVVSAPENADTARRLMSLIETDYLGATPDFEDSAAERAILGS